MATAATHYGQCQICGSQQKLPGGVMAKHGYTVDWGFFSGTCTGSDHKPFEQSKDLVEGAIARALHHAEALDKEAADLAKRATEAKTSARVYREQRQLKSGEKSGYVWVSGRVEQRAPRHGLKFVIVAADGREYYIHNDGYTDTELDVATKYNREWAKSMRAKAEQMRDYVKWQKMRIKNWKPSELKEIPASDLGSAKAKPKVHFKAAMYGHKNTTICSGSATGARRNSMAVKTENREEVTCAACLKELTRRDEMPAKRAAEKEKERLREIKSYEKDVKEYSKWIKAGNDDPMLVMSWTQSLNYAVEKLEELKAAAPKDTPKE